MTTQPEQILEDNLVKQLQQLGHHQVQLPDENALLSNLKSQLAKHNNTEFSDAEFKQVLNHLNKGSVFDKAKILRDKMQINKDDGSSEYIAFINQKQWCKNEFQVAQQITMEGEYKNRYDVTLLINGLPLVQVELKRRGLELKEAFNQTNRYQRHSYGAGQALFNYIQLFVISNGVNTKYYANNRKQSFKQTFFWADKENRNITNLTKFADAFLEPCHLSKMITKYIVLHESDKILMVLRPYQYYATEAIADRVKKGVKNGYIWHTTGSGKTLTSFKASQIMMELPEVHKVVFVVDRRDLDYQTTKEFNHFSEGSVDGTDNTNNLVKQFTDDTKLIVTTIQKLNTAINGSRYQSRMENLVDKRIIFIFDECHRSQFGDTHKAITNFFQNKQMFGFTGTPIFADNASKNDLGKRTTKDLFDDCLHKYVITDAIKDQNVLRFAIEYVGRYKQKNSNNELDIDTDHLVEDIDTKELLESEKRLTKIADYIINNHDRKTHGKTFTGMMCVSSVETLIKYYDILQKKKEAGEHNLKVATIFSYTANEEDKDANGAYGEFEGAMVVEPVATYGNIHTREVLDHYIGDYNKMFGTSYSTKDSKSFYNYYNDISKKVKSKEIDILLVVNMFLTGFDSKTLNTLYVDKNLQYHGLIQAFSRTNRILDEKKSHGNIVCFRNLKKNTDDAILLFSNKEAKEVILVEPYEQHLDKFHEALEKLLYLAPTVESVDNIIREDEQLAFVKAFRNLMRIKHILHGFADYKEEDLDLTAQTFEDYKSKYLDINDKVKNDRGKDKTSILDDVDFELELIHRDEVNVAYILTLLAQICETPDEEKKMAQKKSIIDTLSGEVQLRSKKELIEKFIDQNLPHIKDSDQVTDEFDKFIEVEKQNAFTKLVEEEKLKADITEKVISDYLFTNRTPIQSDVVETFETKPKLLQRKKLAQRVTDKMMGFVETFISGM
ncbi:type I restriction endonuclease subunit R [Flammeovirga sp. EKP202]|uniref:type I restriction endonuclease subunit R n=1 Tax=Flammeovirga sp. EKP202 TaxID=2770592 RepID=UPI00165EDB04|nr:type I restriction endonuclease subunit R [Flammeovirga sp. EKP202]MBD0403882.1 type I restriction endonuclease subunit R [Flammeovirga sp. EKP202]